MHQGNPIHTFMFDKEGVLLSANPAALQRRLPGKLAHLHSLLSTSSPAMDQWGGPPPQHN